MTHADAHVDFTALIEEALEGIEAPKLRHVVMMGQRRPEGMLARDDFDALGNGADEKLLRNRVEGVPLRDTALILYTSGTTSNPRGAMLSHEAFVRTWMVTARVWETESDDRDVERAAALPRDRARHRHLDHWQGRDVLQRLRVRRRAHASPRCATRRSRCSIPPTSRSPRPCSRTRTSTRPT